MRTIGRRETVAIGVIAMIAVIAAGWFLLVKPASAKVSALKQNTSAQEQENDSLRTQISILRGQQKKLPQEQAELATLEKRVPDSVQLPTLLRQMQQIAKDSGANLLGITPTQPAPLTGAAGIDAVGITLTVSGGYAEIEQLDSALESLSRAFLVSGFALTSGSPTGASGAASAGTPAKSAATVNATFTGRVLLRTPSATATTAG